ncbi:proliferating cell nuclear antigen, N-terminal domain-containing protein [Ephemerocybe angulata]|uniref:Proliferating cell nuclear antigen, N-terminal domain-containing protein n=1 Tax=Ephemerocybe angulata TaxID=980116 RepID=A0A8H6I6A4_9AGAR|nr:proliferating cell nuclear antigen, N-terminal domain-containing protein [Tulosesus angulatus]
MAFLRSFIFYHSHRPKLQEADLLKKLLDAINELVTDANFERNEEGINLQAMDNSLVVLVSVLIQAAVFKRYRCDRPMPLGVNLGSLAKVLKCAKVDDIYALKAVDEADLLNAKKRVPSLCTPR